jgi:hypothetical protein
VSQPSKRRPFIKEMVFKVHHVEPQFSEANSIIALKLNFEIHR